MRSIITPIAFTSIEHKSERTRANATNSHHQSALHSHSSQNPQNSPPLHATHHEQNASTCAYVHNVHPKKTLLGRCAVGAGVVDARRALRPVNFHGALARWLVLMKPLADSRRFEGVPLKRVFKRTLTHSDTNIHTCSRLWHT